jgi:hypothetical protein
VAKAARVLAALGFRVPALHIIGGVNGSREDAEREVIKVIEFALEGVEQDFDNDGTEVEQFDVKVRPPQRVPAKQAG